MAQRMPTSAATMSRKAPRDTLIENTPQISIRRAPPRQLAPKRFVSPLSEDFPTPTAIKSQVRSVSPVSSDAESESSSLWSKQSSESEFDELYDLSEASEAEELPIKLSASVKRRVGCLRRIQTSSLSIPSPTQWPTIDKLRSATAMSPAANIALSPAALAKFNLQSLRVPSTSSAPSLDGSWTSEEMAASSCPSTPEVTNQSVENAWDLPIQLDPSAFSMLQHISGQDEADQMDTVIEIPPVPRSEMREMRAMVEAPLVPGRFSLNTHNLPRSPIDGAEEQLSTLSIPSPGGFFASLDSSVRRTWSASNPSNPTPTTSVATEFYNVPFRLLSPSSMPTSTATSFYNVPWQSRPDDTIEHVIMLPSPESETDPITARRTQFSPGEVVVDADEIDETYDANLKHTASANISRTAHWLSAQTNYMKAVCEDDEDDDDDDDEDSGVINCFKDVPDAMPKTPEHESPIQSDSSPSKKSVRFAENTVENQPRRRVSPIHDGTFWEGWRHQKRSQRARDVFQQRQMRAEADHVRRQSCSKQHVEQLQGKFEITNTERPAPQRPVSSLLPVDADDEKTEMMAAVDRERQALQQIQSSSWTTAAQKELNGGALLTSPIVKSFKGRDNVKILDLGGQVHCGWAWAVASDHPRAAVYTTVSSDAEAHVAESTIDGPSNHFVVAAPQPWDLPFPDNHFDVVSARHLHAHLRTIWPRGKAADEWDLTLRECLRCLKPGGFLEFDLLDAEPIHPTPMVQALGVEFAFSLKSRGYDPSSGKSFLPRLKRAGFGDIKRAWIVLPSADVVPKWTDAGKSPVNKEIERSIGAHGEVEVVKAPLTGSTKDVRAVTGIVGARRWEQWMVKLNLEMGRSEERCLQGVAKALEGSGRGNTAWKCLVGWAQKDYE